MRRIIESIMNERLEVDLAVFERVLPFTTLGRLGDFGFEESGEHLRGYKARRWFLLTGPASG